jgi:hypothetical protein
MSVKKESSKGIGCGSLLAVLLTVAFVVLKLCNVITWSWWWVISPIWIYAGLSILIIVIAAFIAAISDD